MTLPSTGIFLNAVDVRNNARTYLIIHEEARGIEEAILFAADSGLLTAYVYNTYCTQTNIPAYRTINLPTVATGTVSSPIFTIGSQITVDGVTATLTGNSLAQTIIDINAALTTAQNITVTASQSNNQLVITDTIGADIITSGAAATVAGLPATTYGTIDTINNKFYLMNHGFKNGDQVILSTTNTLPSPLAGGTTYFVIALDVNTFQLCTSYMDTIYNNPIVIANPGIGQVSIRPYTPQEQFYDAFVGNGNADANRPFIDIMNAITTYFTNLGYTITQVPNTNVTSGNVFMWLVRW